MNAARRKFIAWAALSALLFLQLAVSAYACTMTSPTVPTDMASAESPMPCHDAPPRPSKLCEQHCVQSAQSIDTQPHNAVAAPELPLLAVMRTVETHISASRQAQQQWLAHAVGPPPLERFGVLRI
jgi:hypothetical protein